MLFDIQFLNFTYKLLSNWKLFKTKVGDKCLKFGTERVKGCVIYILYKSVELKYSYETCRYFPGYYDK